MNREEKLYMDEFGDIPDDQLDRIKYILGKRFEDDKYNKSIEKIAQDIKRIRFKKLKFTMWKTQRPSARPRATRSQGYLRLYVPRAREDGDWFSEFAKEHRLPYIDTPSILNLNIYVKTPTAFNIKKKVLAELGFIKPWNRTGDIDNFAKAISDAIQHGLLKDDCLIISSTQHLFYSIKPHVDVELLYMEKFPLT
jgi:Holliday junction resolvase RusA-like endonuclease